MRLIAHIIHVAPAEWAKVKMLSSMKTKCFWDRRVKSDRFICISFHTKWKFECTDDDVGRKSNRYY